MDIKKTIEDKISQPMTRREFLVSSGAVALSLLGAATVLKSLTSSKGPLARTSSRGYGSSPYGR